MLISRTQHKGWQYLVIFLHPTHQQTVLTFKHLFASFHTVVSNTPHRMQRDNGRDFFNLFLNVVSAEIFSFTHVYSQRYPVLGHAFTQIMLT